MASQAANTGRKVVIVTGGCHGIGRGCVEILAENGFTVACWDIDDAEGALVEKKYPGVVYYRNCDVRDEQKIKAGISETVSKFGKLDCLVNNVGRQPDYATIDDYTTDDFRQSLELNLISCFAMCKHALPHLRAVKGNIVNISSITVEYGHPEAVLYVSSKAGIHSMTKCLAIDEAKYGVRVNAIAPGLTRTPMAERLVKSRGGDLETQFQVFSKTNVLRRPCDPREIGKACLYLATDATYCTGSVLHVTGGMDIGFGAKE